jgi:hypothetical protein
MIELDRSGGPSKRIWVGTGIVGDHRSLIWQAGAASVVMSAVEEKRYQHLRLRPNPLLGGSAFSP